MKKTIKNTFRILLLIIIVLIPAIVKADSSERIFYAKILNENIKSNENVEYVVEYSSMLEGISEGETKTVYVIYDSNALNYVSTEEYETKTNSSIQAQIVKAGVIKLTITSKKDIEKFDVKTLTKFSVNSNYKGNTTSVELKAPYDYEPSTCEDCDPFWLGEVDNKSKTKTINITYLVEDTPKSSETTTTANTTNNETKVNNNDVILYASIAFNAVLVITVIALVVKKNKNNNIN